MSDRQQVDFWFDPICPWTWMTSRWMLEVEKVRPVEVRWHVMSLAILNTDTDLPKSLRRMVDRSWTLVRTLVAGESKYGNDVVLPLFTAMGTLIHVEANKDFDEVAARSLEVTGLPSDVPVANDSLEYENELRATHEAGQKVVGMDSGSPIVAVGDVGFFGPVVSPAPKAESAGHLWDGIISLSMVDGFYELKKGRDREPVFD